jgi:hypothetical protein
MAEPEEPMAVTLRRRRFTLDQYHRMGEVGIFRPGDRVELHRRPSARGYQDVEVPGRAVRFAPLAFPDVAVTLTDLLG